MRRGKFRFGEVSSRGRPSSAVSFVGGRASGTASREGEKARERRRLRDGEEERPSLPPARGAELRQGSYGLLGGLKTKPLR